MMFELIAIVCGLVKGQMYRRLIGENYCQRRQRL